MILGMIGAVIILFSVMRTSVSIAGIIIGVVLLISGLLTIQYHDEKMRARRNVRRYWAYGEKPDWTRKRKDKQGQ